MNDHVRSINVNAFNMSSLLCRLCQSSSPSDTAVNLFSQTAAEQRLPDRITDLLDVPVARADGLPGHICCKCKRKLEHLEKAAEELENFRSETKNTYSTLALKRNELKRTKETSSSIGVSPDTLKARPPAKKLTRRHLDFENGEL